MNDVVPPESSPPTAHPLGGVRLIGSQAGESARRNVRLAAAALFVFGAGVLGVAAWLRPDPRGMGTHQQLGAGPCGMLVSTGYPCPTCGMTTAFSYLLHGRLFRSLAAQPAGFVLACATIFVTGLSAVALVRGAMPMGRWLTRVSPFWLYFSLLMLILGGWAYKIIVGLADGSLPMAAVRL
ncbi:MAG: DUF2752 domain-containing protein [Phycisphaerales bacterium]|nr:DUF2752 domain-containing protein [Phycisphaerales bacterium]